jgi:hypothetical protein
MLPATPVGAGHSKLVAAMAKTAAPSRDCVSIELMSAGSEQSINRPVFLTVKEAAALLRLSEITLGRWRIAGYGPPYRKFGRRVIYARDDLLVWAKQQSRSSTSEKA